MTPIRRRQDVIDIAFKHAPSAACQAAMQNSLCETLLLGAFTGIEGLDGWIVQVTSLHGRTWLIAVLVNELDRKLNVRYISTVPWASWAGAIGGTNQLRDGDCPKRASLERIKQCADTRMARSTNE